MDGTTKLYEKIYQDLLAKINKNEYNIGDKIPTEYEITQLYNVSRSTAIKAIKELEKNKLVTRSRKNGTFVAGKQIDDSIQHIIPLVLPYEDNFNSDILDGAHEFALAHNSYISFFNTYNSNKKEREILNKILAMKPCGIILYPCSLYSNIDILSDFVINKIPITFLDRAIPGIKGTLVTSDNKKGQYELTNELIRLGHTKIAFHSIHNNMLETERNRFEGYCEALIANNIPINYKYIFRINEDIRHKHTITPTQKKQDIIIDYVRKTIVDYLAMDEKPTVISCINDEAALLMIEECKNEGIRIPEDLSITGFDFTNNSKNSQPILTTVKQNFFELGRLAVKSLHEQINSYNINYTIPTEISVGGSVTDINIMK